MTAATVKAQYRALQYRWRMVLGTPLCDLSMGERDILRRMLESANQEDFKRDGLLVSRFGREHLAKYANVTPRYVTDVRKKLAEEGVVICINEGGHGAKDTAVLALSDRWLNKVETELRAKGIKLGAKGEAMSSPLNAQKKGEAMSSPLNGPGMCHSASSRASQSSRDADLLRVNSDPAKGELFRRKGEQASSPESYATQNLDASQNPSASYEAASPDGDARSNDASLNGHDDHQDDEHHDDQIERDQFYYDTLDELANAFGETPAKAQTILDVCITVKGWDIIRIRNAVGHMSPDPEGNGETVSARHRRFFGIVRDSYQ